MMLPGLALSRVYDRSHRVFAVDLWERACPAKRPALAQQI